MMTRSQIAKAQQVAQEWKPKKERLSNRKWRELLGRYIFGLQEAE